MVYASGGINRRISLATKETTVNTEQTDLTEKTTSGKKGINQILLAFFKLLKTQALKQSSLS